MPSFPKIQDVPPLLSTVSWAWERYRTPTFPSRDFWIGTDLSGNLWLTKLKGGFYGYRELVFGRLAQRIGWSCQTSTFAELDDEAVQILGKPNMERFHAVHWFMPEHPPRKCTHNCPMSFLLDRSISSIDDLTGSEILHLLDWPKSEFAACLFGGNEPPDRLFTLAHEFVIIDSEMMFASKPSAVSGTRWWNSPDETPSIRGQQVALEVCSEVAALAESEIEGFLRRPEQVEFEERWPIAPLLKASYGYAKQFAKTQAET